MIAILAPSRGFTFTRTDIAIDEIRYRFDTKVFRTYDRPIPDAHNALVEMALGTGAEMFLFIEEDVVPPIEKVVEMVNHNRDISFVDYGVNGWSCSAKNERGEILWAGLGCTLIKRQVFEKLEKPYFRTDRVLRLNDRKWLEQKAKYGGHDVWFFTKAREAGFEIFQVEGECEHLRLKELGKPSVNNGLHLIFEKSRIKHYQIIEGGV